MSTGPRACPPFDINATFFVMLFYLEREQGTVAVQRWVGENLMTIIRPLYGRAALFEEVSDPTSPITPVAFVELQDYWRKRDSGELVQDSEVAGRRIKNLPSKRRCSF
ncbi:hypothetical protein B0H16DRAFT_1740019 [Mycena metata]|uniref:Uncharacterized protein n=1 Tax=Mycena metata TaxID=1033252 RepID=A0AAD7HFD1_9AGAR|nr:hypothetical protein B0H16DRAFT_1740019 [Mycena metata]